MGTKALYRTFLEHLRHIFKKLPTNNIHGSVRSSPLLEEKVLPWAPWEESREVEMVLRTLKSRCLGREEGNGDRRKKPSCSAVLMDFLSWSCGDLRINCPHPLIGSQVITWEAWRHPAEAVPRWGENLAGFRRWGNNFSLKINQPHKGFDFVCVLYWNYLCLEGFPFWSIEYLLKEKNFGLSYRTS